jgi:hypothetical protein
MDSKQSFYLGTKFAICPLLTSNHDNVYRATLQLEFHSGTKQIFTLANKLNF